MQELILKTSEKGSVLATAATSGDLEFFRAVVTWIMENVTTEQVRVN